METSWILWWPWWRWSWRDTETFKLVHCCLHTWFDLNSDALTVVCFRLPDLNDINFVWPQLNIMTVPACLDALWHHLHRLSVQLRATRQGSDLPAGPQRDCLVGHKPASMFNHVVMERSGPRAHWPVARGMPQIPPRGHARESERDSLGLRSLLPPPPPFPPPRAAPLCLPARRPPSPGVCTWAPPAPAPRPASPWGAPRCARVRCRTRASSRSCGGRPWRSVRIPARMNEGGWGD